MEKPFRMVLYDYYPGSFLNAKMGQIQEQINTHILLSITPTYPQKVRGFFPHRNGIT
jgi:hypothetical protein